MPQRPPLLLNIPIPLSIFFLLNTPQSPHQSLLPLFVDIPLSLTILLPSDLIKILILAVSVLAKNIGVMESMDQVRENKVIVLDAGHGGSDPGKIGINKALEKDVNLSIVLKLKEELEKKGYQVVLTRDTDEGLYQETDNNKKQADMKKRCEIIEANRFCHFLLIFLCH